MESLSKINSDNLLWTGYLGMFFFLPIATSPVVICGVFVLGVWIFSGKFLRDITTWQNSKIILPVIILIVLPWVGLIYTPLPTDGFPVAVKTHYWLYALAITPVLTTQKQPELIIKMFLLGLSLNSAISILQFAGLVPLKKGLATGLLGGSSAHIPYSLLLTTGILIASFYFLKARSKREHLLYISAMLQYFATISFTGGRSGYVALIVLSPFIVYNILGQRHIVKILIVSILAVALLFSFPVVQSRFLKAKEDVVLYTQGNVNTSIGLRFHMWEIAVSEMKKNPILGIGTAGFKKSWELHKKDPALPFFDHPHNSFLYMMVSFGIVGLVAFCSLLFIMLKRGWKCRDSAPGFAVFAFTGVFIIGSLTDTQVLPFATAIALPLFTGVSEALHVA
ncbi:MAG: O-antigen ligase family protein [Nitrospirota bacterium]|nr:O-antigen ligase family protein [Nitrospirota bacterium]MDH5768672.1 O-antigen ligase family protein [Nitrospirota bacterium]